MRKILYPLYGDTITQYNFDTLKRLIDMKENKPGKVFGWAQEEDQYPLSDEEINLLSECALRGNVDDKYIPYCILMVVKFFHLYYCSLMINENCVFTI